MRHSLRLLLTAGAFAMALASAQVTPPPVPSTIQVPDGNVPYLKGQAVGTQNYTCVPSGGAYIWNGAPQATLFMTLKFYNIEAQQQIATTISAPTPPRMERLVRPGKAPSTPAPSGATPSRPPPIPPTSPRAQSHGCCSKSSAG
jgi:hypothetical protein